MVPTGKLAIDYHIASDCLLIYESQIQQSISSSNCIKKLSPTHSRNPDYWYHATLPFQKMMGC